MKSGVMLAATGSGCGKTTVTLALLAALKNKGLAVRSFKCGPDYIDPLFHKEVVGVPSENLDLFLAGDEGIRTLFYRNNSSDISVVEGVMGLYDGISPESIEGSSYDLACKLDLPIVLVVNARGMGRSLLAIIGGFLAMDREHRMKGVILNRISPAYYEKIRPVIEKELAMEVLGYYPEIKGDLLESRYLGLKLPHEKEGLNNLLSEAGNTIAETVDLDRLLTLGVISPWPDMSFAGSAAESSDRIRIGIARDEAFCFFYEENLRMLEEAGADIIPFSPLRDKELPKNLDGLIFPGGYPELHAETLSGNKEMLLSVKKAVLSGMPSLAECGGFMYLHDSVTVNGTKYPMVGLVQGSCEKKDRLVRFGYLTIEEKVNLFLKGKNRSLRGHEFHYYDSTDNGSDGICQKPRSCVRWEAAHIDENHWWGFAHLYYSSNEEFAKAFVEKCKQRRRACGEQL